MYTAFYGLREKPFSLTPNPRFLYLTDAHKEALAHLLYGLEQGEGFIVITGEVGTGKTTLCRSLLERIDLETEIAILFNPSENARELLQSINEEFGLQVEGLSRRQLLGTLNRFLLDRNAEGRRVVLIVDEAQHLSPATLEQVRLLSNLETAASKLIQIILLGQPELDAKLDSDELRQLRQRVSVRWRLESMSAEETGQYIRHRLNVAAGADREILTPRALLEIHRRTGGVPRLVNALTDRVLLGGFAAEKRRIGPAQVRKAAGEIPGVRPAPAGWPLRVGLPAAALAVLLLAFGILFWPEWRSWTGQGEELSAPRVEPTTVFVAATSPAADAAEPEEGLVPSVQGELPMSDAFSAVEEVAFSREIPVSALAVAAQPPNLDAGVARDPGGFLAALLFNTDHRLGVDAATRALMEMHGVTPDESLMGSAAGAVSALRAADLGVAEFEENELAPLLAINYPALLELRTVSGETRIVALLGVDGDIVELSGVDQRDSLRVSIGALEDHFTGMAWVVWRPYLDIPDLIGEGERGAGVLWLQEALSRLGYGDVRITGTYDTATALGVEVFQARHGIRVDGLAGPFTQMLIYGELEEYSPPRLEREDSG